MTCRIKTPNGYTVTMDGIVLTAEFFMNYDGEGGCLTPSQLMGADLVERLWSETKRSWRVGVAIFSTVRAGADAGGLKAGAEYAVSGYWQALGRNLSAMRLGLPG